MTKLPFATAALPFLALAACNSQPSQPKVIDTNPDPMAAELANAKPVELPPAVRASATMRCKDNSLVYVDFFQGDKQANLKTATDGPSHHLTAANAGDPLAGDGFTVTGNEKSITLAQPGKGELTCKA